jgi:hypothetical protein
MTFEDAKASDLLFPFLVGLVPPSGVEVHTDVVLVRLLVT